MQADAHLTPLISLNSETAYTLFPNSLKSSTSGCDRNNILLKFSLSQVIEKIERRRLLTVH